ncbi:hypothetical protein Leryth_001609 [Lithospermum erythrorhizon]|nr:hypothetical protein Leryth_001609 [Lithospermum erythrorhizon]
MSAIQYTVKNKLQSSINNIHESDNKIETFQPRPRKSPILSNIQFSLTSFNHLPVTKLIFCTTKQKFQPPPSKPPILSNNQFSLSSFNHFPVIN